jgi:hypothetical protein
MIPPQRHMIVPFLFLPSNKAYGGAQSMEKRRAFTCINIYCKVKLKGSMGNTSHTFLGQECALYMCVVNFVKWKKEK